MINNDEGVASGLPEVQSLAKSVLKAEKQGEFSREKAVDKLWKKAVENDPELAEFEYDGKSILATVLNWAIEDEEYYEKKKNS